VTLTYTLDRLLTEQAPVERDTATTDAFGGETKTKREVVATPRCRFWWWRESGSRSPSKEYATPQRTINFTGGGIVVPRDTDIRDGDHVKEIQNPAGETLVEGPFRVVAVEQTEDHLEAALMRP
jgi:hypothetical protein